MKKEECMLAIGRTNHLKIARLTPIGAYLATDRGEILLPEKYRPADTGVGSTVDVFVYLDSEDRLVATTLKPRAMVGEFASLQVKETGQYGAFLDWGLEKDLLVPFAEQTEEMVKGKKYLVRLYEDNTGRIAASAKLEKFLHGSPPAAGEEVELLVYRFSQMGATVIINGASLGLLFRDELHRRWVPGERTLGYVKRLRPDGKVDVTLKKPGSDELSEARDRILAAVESNDGFLPLHDKSSPEAISRLLQMSKKTFKKASGSLYREGKIVITQEGLKRKGEES